ncbi:MAG TPA: heparan-alpha-glucosaminide N-acetyltransferase domain-containing protein [Gemmatimonadaceae bacterium]|nr:heparan-alpha-glucosaminide N-acetyltransferase domain-containing protein [Gemmatimonadaceae bacterium]
MNTAQPDSVGLAPGRPRVMSLDIARGAVMVLMAIDHVRVYAGVPAGGPTPGVFFTRWITHFCAPAFVFLAGTGAFLHGQKLGHPRKLAQYLVTRGIILVLLELTVIRASWTFNVDYANWILAGVIWMLGWCMVLLAALVALPVAAIGAIGIAIVLAQTVFGGLGGALPSALRSWWEFIYPIGSESGPAGMTVLYSIVPWIGVMAAGYAFGAIMVRDAASRRRLCLQIGLGATAAFVLIAGYQAFVQTAADGAPPAWIRFFNQEKYPASVLFLLMTLGPTVALLPFAENARGRVASVLATFGRVPMFYYLLHIPLIHIVALAVWSTLGGAGDWFATAPYVAVPASSQWSLIRLYVVFAVVVALLYFPCRWYAGVKARRSDGWLRYI